MALTAIIGNDAIYNRNKAMQQTMTLALLRCPLFVNSHCYPSMTDEPLDIISHDGQTWAVFDIFVEDDATLRMTVMRGEYQVDTLDAYDIMPDELAKVYSLVIAIKNKDIKYAA